MSRLLLLSGLLLWGAAASFVPNSGARALQIARLKSYAHAARFPINSLTSSTSPIFIDDLFGARCAVAELMTLDGYGADAAAIAAANVTVDLSELAGPPALLLPWLRQSGLTFAEAAAIQPGYSATVRTWTPLVCNASAGPAGACDRPTVECYAGAFIDLVEPLYSFLAAERVRLRAHFDAIINGLEADPAYPPVGGVSGAPAAGVADQELPALPSLPVALRDALDVPSYAHARAHVATAHVLQSVLEAEVVQGPRGRLAVASIACEAALLLPRYWGGEVTMWGHYRSRQPKATASMYAAHLGGYSAVHELLFRATALEVATLGFGPKLATFLEAPNLGEMVRGSPVLSAVGRALRACTPLLFPSFHVEIGSESEPSYSFSDRPATKASYAIALKNKPAEEAVESRRNRFPKPEAPMGWKANNWEYLWKPTSETHLYPSSCASKEHPTRGPCKPYTPLAALQTVAAHVDTRNNSRVVVYGGGRIDGGDNGGVEAITFGDPFPVITSGSWERAILGCLSFDSGSIGAS